MNERNERTISRAVKIAARLKPLLEADGITVPVPLTEEESPEALVQEAMAAFIAFCALTDWEPGIPTPAMQHGMATFKHSMEAAGTFDHAIRMVRERLELPLAENAEQRMQEITVEGMVQQLQNVAGMGVAGIAIIPMEMPEDEDEDE